MDWNRPEQVDAAIESMLRAEPMRTVPAGFGRKVKNRVAMAAMLDTERQQWRYVRGAMSLGAAMLAGCFLAAASYPRMLEWAVGWFVPGGAGYFDYLVSLAWYGAFPAAAFVAVLTATVASGVLLGYVLQRKFPASRS